MPPPPPPPRRPRALSGNGPWCQAAGAVRRRCEGQGGVRGKPGGRSAALPSGPPVGWVPAVRTAPVLRPPLLPPPLFNSQRLARGGGTAFAAAATRAATAARQRGCHPHHATRGRARRLLAAAHRRRAGSGEGNCQVPDAGTGCVQEEGGGRAGEKSAGRGWRLGRRGAAFFSSAWAGQPPPSTTTVSLGPVGQGRGGGRRGTGGDGCDGYHSHCVAGVMASLERDGSLPEGRGTRGGGAPRRRRVGTAARGDPPALGVAVCEFAAVQTPESQMATRNRDARGPACAFIPAGRTKVSPLAL